MENTIANIRILDVVKGLFMGNMTQILLEEITASM
jgi:hypothetical protein